MNPNALPIELRHCPQWVCWRRTVRHGRHTKIPVDAASGRSASTSDPATWATFEEVLSWARRSDIDGIGFVFTADDSYVGVDLDDCREPEDGSLSDDAVAIVTRLHTYTEVSPSGTGLHLIAKGSLPAGRRRHGSVEMYDESRFFTMTGERLPGTPAEVGRRSSAVRSVHAAYVAANDDDEATSDTGDESSERLMAFTVDLDDDTLIEKASTAANGEKFSALWSGDISGYQSQSEADMALCCLLAFWTASDPSRVDQLFRQSGLIRKKWNAVHYADGATYGERTVERACARVSDHYQGE